MTTLHSAGKAAREGLVTCRLSERDIPACVAMAQESFSDFQGNPEAVAQWFEARILRNPWQPLLEGIGVGIRKAGELVAFRAMFAQPWWMNGQETVVAFAAHTAVDQAYRGQGLGFALVEASSSFAGLTGSTSAGSATQKIYARQGFVPIGGDGNGFHQCRVGYAGSLHRRVGGTAARVLGRLLDLTLDARWTRIRTSARGEFRQIERCDHEVDRLWSNVQVEESSCLLRSARYLNWRVFDEPTCDLRLGSFRDRTGKLRAVAAWATLDFPGGVRCAVLRDVLVCRSDEEAVRGLFAELLLYWRRDGFTWARFEVSSTALERLYCEMGLDAVHSHGNRYWIHAHPSLASEITNDWFRSGLDGDYFDCGSR